MLKPNSGIVGIVALVALVLASYAVFKIRTPEAKIGFVNSQRIVTGFKPAYEVEKQLQKEEEEFKSKLKIKEDSLKSFMDTLSARYNKVDVKVKRMLQDELAARNQELNNISQAHARRMDKMRAEKMGGIFEMINAYMLEFGRKNKYAIIFGTVQGGNILYGESTAADVTQSILDGLNDRYK